MKPITRNSLYIAAACVMAGLLFVILSFAAGGFRLESISTGLPYEQRSYSYTLDEVKSLDINGRFCDIRLAPSKSNELVITTFENEQEYFEFDVSATRELSINQIINKRWYNYIGVHIDLVDRAMVIEVPEGLLGEIDVSSQSGTIHVTELVTNDMVALSSKSGDIKVDGLSAPNQVSVNSKSGEIKLSKVLSGGDLTAASASGDIKVSGVQINGRMSVDSMSGGVKIDEGTVKEDLGINTHSGDASISAVQAARNILVKSSSGRVFLGQTVTDGDITVDTRSGDIRFKTIRANNFNFTSASGEVNGDIDDASENYTIRSKSKSGSIRLPDSGNGSKQLNVSTKSGDIKIDFLG